MKLALGTVQFGLEYGIANKRGRVSLHEARNILTHARASGMDMLDTAIGYGDSEQRLGEIGVGGWQVVSKLPAVPSDCGDIGRWAAAEVAGSLRRLRVGQLGGLLLHRPQQLLEKGGDDLYRALERLKQSGLVQKVGISIYAPDELDALLPRFDLDLVQAPFNLLDHRLVESGWMERLAGRGVELHARSIFLQGLLLMKPGERPARFGRWATLWAEYDAWLEGAQLSAVQACLRHALSFSGIARVIIGVDGVSQLKEILRAAEGSMPPLPAGLRCTDPDLLNPARWAALQATASSAT
ncbi:MAG: aldo/keto reductase [Pseudomonadota bacterium]